MKWTQQALLLIGLSGAAQAVAANHNYDLAKMLGWRQDKLLICKGYFSEDAQVSRFPHPGPLDQSRTTITANDESSFSQTSTSVLRGNVTVRQQGRLLKADTVRVYRNPRTQDISIIDLYGNVSLQESGKKLAAQKARIDIEKNNISIMNGGFHREHQTPLEMLNAWGSAQKAFRDQSGNLSLHNASYSVCPLKHPFWQIRAQKIYLNNQTGVGSAKHARFLLWGMPIFYTPYISYPIKNQRKSGFLTPGFHYDEKDGFAFRLPYYFNLAPNYDDLFEPEYMTKRGFKLNNHFRYLTEKNEGSLYAAVLPDDREFRSFQRDSKNQYANQPEFTPFLSRIENASPTRYSVSFKNRTTFNPHWGGSLTANYVSDDYYLHDFGSDALSSNTVNLFNQAEVHYASDHWQVLARTNGYQTLHPIGNISVEPYNRVPQLAATAWYPRSLFCLDYEFWLDYTNFDHRRNFYDNTAVVSGNRLHLLPVVGYMWRRPYAYFNPVFRADITNYWLRDQDRDIDQHINRLLPIGSVDAGLIFQRNTHYYRQTLEPRVYYLIIPRQNQNDIPLFDTTLPRFNFEQLFYFNRFTGYDRVGDANEITFALSSRFYDNYSGFERFATSIGVMYQFSKRSVCLTPECEEDFVGDDKWSPILFNATYHVTPATYAQADVAFDPNNARTNTGNVRLHYEPAPNHIMHVGFDYVRNGDRTEQDTFADLNRIDLAFAWPLGARWDALADWNYNLSHSHIQHYMVGLGYDSCCFALRAIISRTALTLNLDDNAKVDTKYYLEIKFKGLGTLGNSNPSQLLDTSITGFKDIFRN